MTSRLVNNAYMYLTGFLKPNLTKIYSHLTEKAGFLSPIRSKITVTKERERRKRRSWEKKRRRREKNNGCTFIVATVGFWPKKLLDGKGPFGGNVFKNPPRYSLVYL